MVGEKREVFYRQLLEKITHLPGVESASAINHLPLAGDIWGWEVNIEGRPLPKPGEAIGAVYRVVRPAYFQTMHISLLRGRDFTPQDNAKPPGVAIINERFVRQHWPKEDPIGKRVTLIDAKKNPYWRTIIGIAANAKQSSWSDDPDNEIYVPFLQSDFATNTRLAVGKRAVVAYCGRPSATVTCHPIISAICATGIASLPAPIMISDTAGLISSKKAVYCFPSETYVLVEET